MKSLVTTLVTWVQQLKAVRVFVHYGKKRGPLLASGLSYQFIFAVFAALWVGFAVAGLVLQAQPALRGAVFTIIGTSVPGLFDTGDGNGAIDPDTLLQQRTLSLTGAVALVGLFFTALGWLASCRSAVRSIFELPQESLNFALLKLKDLGLAIGFGIVLLISAALSVFSTQALGFVYGLLGIGAHSFFAELVGHGVGLLLTLILDMAVLGALFRVLSGLRIPLRQLFVGSLLGAVALGALKVLGTSLLGGASRNPLLASFAVIIGLLIWFNLVCQVILLSGAWIAVSVTDKGIEVDPAVTAARLERERAEAARVEAEAAALEAARMNRPWLVRLLQPHPGKRKQRKSRKERQSKR